MTAPAGSRASAEETARQRGLDLVNLIRVRMRKRVIPVTVLDDVAAALAQARRDALAEAERVCRERYAEFLEPEVLGVIAALRALAAADGGVS